MNPTLQIICGDALLELRKLPADSVHCICTSPPYYGLRDYKTPGQIGLERTLDEYLAKLVAVFAEVRRVLHPSGIVFCDIGDSYAGGGRGGNPDDSPFRKQATNRGSLVAPSNSNLPAKNRILVPFRLALLLQADGWWVRDVICWHKPAPMPESVTDRCTQSWEPILMLTKSARYFWDSVAIKEPAVAGFNGSSFTNERDFLTKHNLGNGPRTDTGLRNPRNVWTIGPEPCTDAHFATFPSELPKRCILAGTSARGVCQKCGAPWERVLETDYVDNPGHKWGPRGTAFVDPGKRSGQGFDDSRMPIKKTIDWTPGCRCAAGDPIPATVCDPFVGSFTTCAVALELGRNAIGIELSEAYCQIGRNRCHKITPGLALA